MQKNHITGQNTNFYICHIQHTVKKSIGSIPVDNKKSGDVSTLELGELNIEFLGLLWYDPYRNAMNLLTVLLTGTGTQVCRLWNERLLKVGKYFKTFFQERYRRNQKRIMLVSFFSTVDERLSTLLRFLTLYFKTNKLNVLLEGKQPVITILKTDFHAQSIVPARAEIVTLLPKRGFV